MEFPPLIHGLFEYGKNIFQMVMVVYSDRITAKKHKASCCQFHSNYFACFLSVKAAYVCVLIVEVGLAGEFIPLLGGNLFLNFLGQDNLGYEEFRQTTIFSD
jgi:hypothetical protein